MLGRVVYYKKKNDLRNQVCENWW